MAGIFEEIEMRIPAPAGKILGKQACFDFGGWDAGGIKGTICISFGTGWVAVERGRVIAAFYEDGQEQLFGIDALSRLCQSSISAELYECDGRLLETLVRIFPEISIGRSYRDLMLEIRSLDLIDTIVGPKFVEPAASSPSGAVSQESEVGLVDEHDNAGLVANIEEYLSKIGDFTGIVEASDGGLNFSFWVREGKIVAALMDDGGIKVGGNSVLYFCGIPAKVRRSPWQDPPPEARCSENEREVRALLASLETV
jgi:hypothetical protein